MTMIEQKRDEAKKKAIDALAVYKFQMFGYWASIWVHLNNLCPRREANPFRSLVEEARRLKKSC
jgi:hypothetical protein